MPADLTVTHAQDRLGDDDVFGWACPEHPSYAPTGLTQRHATNSMAKHNREHHPQDDLAHLESLISQETGGIDLESFALAQAILDAGYVRPPM